MELAILIVVIALLLGVAGGVLGLVAVRRRALPPAPPSAEVEPTPAAPEPQAAPPPGLVGAQAAPPEAAPPVAVLERPEPAEGRLVRLRARLARSQGALGKGLLALLSRDTLDEAAWEEIEDTLLTADVGVAPAQELVERLRGRVRVLGTRTPQEVRELLRAELLTMVDAGMDRTLRTTRHTLAEPPGLAEAAAVPAGGDGVGDSVSRDGASGDGVGGATAATGPAVVLVVGVNGTGKTTTVGKLARVLVAEGRTVLLGAADTFRAAAADQLSTWGERVGATTVRGPEGGDPASVAFEAVRQGILDGVDTVIVDTAGRLHTKTGLMDELGKVKRVVEKHGAVDEVLLVLDATTGQNGMVQARVFAEVVNITGIALTKLDGTAKGGIVIAVQRELGVPVKLVGLGEGPDDLAPFEPAAFVDALIGD